MKKTDSISIINWAAHIIGTLMVAFTLFIGIGELLERQNKPGPGLDSYTILKFVAWGIGLAGVLFAIWEPSRRANIIAKFYCVQHPCCT